MKYLLLIISLIFNLGVYYVSAEKKFIEEGIIISFLLFSFYYFLSTILKKNSQILFAVVIVFLVLLSVNQIFGLSTYWVYNDSFNYGYALSILNTHIEEVFSMLSGMIFLLPLFFVHSFNIIKLLHNYRKEKYVQ